MNRYVNKDGRFVIPKEIRNELGIDENTKLSIEVNKNKIILTPKKGKNKFEEYMCEIYSNPKYKNNRELIEEIYKEYITYLND